MATLEDVARIVLMGIGATAVMDVWLIFMKVLGVPTLSFALVGRWIGHLWRGKFAHASIGQASPIRGELTLGWIAHYAVGIAFAWLLVCIQGVDWLHQPILMPAISVGAATVAVPLFVIQPAMGAGFASSKTPTPAKNCLRSVMTHTVFGLGLYLSAVLIAYA
ncbi:DUF2938 domain-containing protein [Bordetella tumulicola]|uniref:DUF2938 domain-containing protein n=1 Tax=Bordetella tumulicola TaxID=1649133 RepID=UPI0039EF1540